MKKLKSPELVKYWILGGALLLAVIVASVVTLLYIQAINQQNALEENRLLFEQSQYEHQRATDIEKEQRKAIDEYNREVQLETCLLEAQGNYTSNWQSSCQSLSVEREDDYQQCLDTCGGPYLKCGGGDDDESYCRNRHPALDPTDCRLPSFTAQRWDTLLESEKDRCYEQYGS